jgi:hypothetical protein
MTHSLPKIALSVVCTIGLLQARPATGQTPDDGFRADVDKLLRITGASQLASQVASTVSAQILDGMKKSQPSIPDRALAITREVLDAEFAKAFSGPQNPMNEMASVYARHFTHDDIRGLLAFYESDLGKKSIQLMPVVLQESMAIGQRWGQAEMPRIMATLQARLRAEGFIK